MPEPRFTEPKMSKETRFTITPDDRPLELSRAHEAEGRSSAPWGIAILVIIAAGAGAAYYAYQKITAPADRASRAPGYTTPAQPAQPLDQSLLQPNLPPQAPAPDLQPVAPTIATPEPAPVAPAQPVLDVAPVAEPKSIPTEAPPAPAARQFDTMPVETPRLETPQVETPTPPVLLTPPPPPLPRADTQPTDTSIPRIPGVASGAPQRLTPPDISTPPEAPADQPLVIDSNGARPANGAAFAQPDASTPRPPTPRPASTASSAPTPITPPETVTLDGTTYVKGQEPHALGTVPGAPDAPPDTTGAPSP